MHPDMGNTTTKGNGDETVFDEGLGEDVEDEAKASSAKENMARLKKNLGKNQALLIARAVEAGLYKMIETMKEPELAMDVTIQSGLVQGICSSAMGVTEATENNSRYNFHTYKVAEHIGMAMQRFEQELKDPSSTVAKEDTLSFLSLCCETLSQIAKIESQKEWLVVEGSIPIVLETMKAHADDDKIAFWGTNALYHISRKGPELEIDSIRAMKTAGAKETLDDIVILQPDNTELIAHVTLLLSSFEALWSDEDIFHGKDALLKKRAEETRENENGGFGGF